MTDKQPTRIDRERRFGFAMLAAMVTIAAAQVIVGTSMPSATVEDQLTVAPLIGAAGGAALIATMLILGVPGNDE